MAAETISQLTAMSQLAANDLLVCVDVSDTTMAPTGTDKQLTVSQFLGAPANGNLLGWEGVPTPIVVGSGLTLTGSGPYTLAATGGGGGSGSVTTVSVATANGFGGTVATATTTPAITITVGVSGILKGNGTGVSQAAAGTDYQAPIALTTTGTSGAATFSGNTLNIPGYQGSITLTTTGSSGAATLSGNTLNIPNYASGAGTVTGFSVAATPSWMSSSVATATTTPALTLSAATGQTANEFLATPSGSSGAVGLRTIVAADLPTTGLQINSHYGTITVDSPSAGAVTCNFATTDKHSVTMTANTTITLSGMTAGQIGVIVLIQGGSGSCMPTFSPALDYGLAGTPTWSTAVGKKDTITVFYDGTSYQAGAFGTGF